MWLRDVPGIEFRTDNEPFKVHFPFVRVCFSFWFINHIFRFDVFAEGDAEVCDEDCGPDARSRDVLLARRSCNHAAGRVRIFVFSEPYFQSIEFFFFLFYSLL